MITMLYYYNLKKIIQKMPSNVTKSMDLSDDAIFNAATFTDLGRFFTQNLIKKDKYALHKKIEGEKFNEFLFECTQTFKKDVNPEQLLFIYGFINHYYVTNQIQAFLSSKVNKKVSYDYLTNMLDYYFTKVNDSYDLSKDTLYKKFPNAFTYTESMDDLIKNPLIKVFSFFGSKEYFTKAMLHKKRYYKSFAKRSIFKYIPYKIYDIVFNHRGKPKAKNYHYNNKVDTKILNFQNKPYLVGDETFKYNVKEVLEIALKESLELIKIINSFFFNNEEKEYRKFFNIEKDQKI
ncbi:MAG: hypothetical protein IKP12_06100 [Acholeplasmatales bacterium]|nr:hypothetical protein [Acholeplasmatales bacterium]